MSDFYGTGSLNYADAKLEAQKIAFAPFVFQATRILRDRGILKALEEAGEEGLTLKDLEDKISMSSYGIYVLLDAGVSSGIIEEKDEHYILTRTGYFIENDEITRVNMDFTQDINYLGLFKLEEAIDQRKPVGLEYLGKWDTIYEGLSQLTEKQKKSWFDFDHYYSDTSFPKALPVVFKDKPKKLLDIGGNTGKWSLQCVKYNEDVNVTILDLPGQLKKAEENIAAEGFSDRIDGHPINLLDHSAEFPKGYDAIWMSQFLDCFPPEDIISILERSKRALADGGIIYIMETFIDRQRFEMAKYCLDMTSLYFTALANGTSRMYHATDFIKYIEEAGLKVVEDIDNVGLSHTILKCGV